MLIALLIIAALIILPLFVPAGGEVIYEKSQHRFHLIVAGIRFVVPRSLGKAKEKQSKEAEPGSISDTIGQFFALQETFFKLWEFYDGNLIGMLLRTMKRYYRTLHIRVHHLNLSIGTQDPAMTGMLYGTACSLTAALPATIPVVLTPDFVNEKSSLNYRLSLTVIPARVLFELLRTTLYLRLWAVPRILRES